MNLNQPFLCDRLLYDSANWIYILNQNFEFVYANKAFLNFFQLKEEDVIGQHYSKYYEKGMLTFYIGNEIEKFQDEKLVLNETFQDKYHSDKHFDTSVEKFKDDEGNNYLFVVSKDISYEVLYNELVETNQNFYKNINYYLSHDLKKSVRLIQSFSSLMEKNIEKKGSKGSIETLEFLEYIKLNGSYLSDMFEKLNGYFGYFTKKIDDSEVNLNEILESVYEKEVERSDVKIDYEVSSLPVIKGDFIALYNLFSEIVDNAIKFMSKNKKPKLIISSTRENDSAIISIKDNGIGFSNVNRFSVFEMMSRLQKGDDFSGYGLGLAIAKKITELHKGQIWVDSEIGKGSTFFIKFPKWRVLSY